MPAPDWVIEQWPGCATIIAVRSQGTRDGRPVDETRYYVTSLRTSAKALLRLVRNRRSIENSWHWVRDVTLREDAHRYRETNGVQIVAMLRTMAINSVRLKGSGRSQKELPPWRTTSRDWCDCWGGGNLRRHRRRDDF